MVLAFVWAAVIFLFRLFLGISLLKIVDCTSLNRILLIRMVAAWLLHTDCMWFSWLKISIFRFRFEWRVTHFEHKIVLNPSNANDCNKIQFLKCKWKCNNCIWSSRYFWSMVNSILTIRFTCGFRGDLTF